MSRDAQGWRENADVTWGFAQDREVEDPFICPECASDDLAIQVTTCSEFTAVLRLGDSLCGSRGSEPRIDPGKLTGRWDVHDATCGCVACGYFSADASEFVGRSAQRLATERR